jgi:hypothetical protein
VLLCVGGAADADPIGCAESKLDGAVGWLQPNAVLRTQDRRIREKPVRVSMTCSSPVFDVAGLIRRAAVTNPPQAQMRHGHTPRVQHNRWLQVERRVARPNEGGLSHQSDADFLRGGRVTDPRRRVNAVRPQPIEKDVSVVCGYGNQKPS